MNLLQKIDYYLLTNHPVLWRTKVHYFVLFSLILGNIAAYSICQLLKSLNLDVMIRVLPVVVLFFVLLVWMISQARVKIKVYRFWDEVITLGAYIFCATLLYINLSIFLGFSLGIYIEKSVVIVRNSHALSLFSFVFAIAALVYLATHTNIVIGIGAMLLFVAFTAFSFYFDGSLFGVLLMYVVPILTFIPENSRIIKFCRLVSVPFIPFGVLAFNPFYILPPILWCLVFLVASVATAFGGAFLIKNNFRPI